MPPSSRGTAIIALFSMYSCSWWPTRYSPSMTEVRPRAKPASTSPLRDLVVGEDCVDSSGSKTGGSGSVRERDRACWASRRVSRSARREERDRLGVMLDLAAEGRGPAGRRAMRADDVVAGDVLGGQDGSPGTSRSPGRGRSPSSRACGSVERIVAPYQAPGKTRSSVYSAAPVSLAGPSRRVGSGTATPRTGVEDGVAGVRIVRRMGPPWQFPEGCWSATGGVEASDPGVGPRASLARRRTRASPAGRVGDDVRHVAGTAGGVERLPELDRRGRRQGQRQEAPPPRAREPQREEQAPR